MEEGTIHLGLPPILREAYAPYKQYIERGDVKEIVINRPMQVGLELQDGSWEWLEDRALHEDFLYDSCRQFANYSGQVFDARSPLVGFKFPGGHRVQVISGSSTESFALAIRVNRNIAYELADWNLSDKEIRQLIADVQAHKTILVSGGTSTGKTSLLNTLIRFIDDTERLVTIEGVPELHVPHQNWLPLYYSENNTAVGSVDVATLVNTSLRLRPDRILMGEIRKENAYPFSHAINTGHEGSMATIHANSCEAAIRKIVDYAVLQGHIASGAEATLIAQLEKDIGGVVQITRTHNIMHATYQRFT